MISISVTFAILLYSVIVLDVYFVLSRFAIKLLFSKIVDGSASDNYINKFSSNLSNYTENSFYYFTNSYLFISNSFLSILTTAANNYSSKPDSVTIKLIIVHYAAISGLKCGLYNFVIKNNLNLGS